MQETKQNIEKIKNAKKHRTVGKVKNVEQVKNDSR